MEDYYEREYYAWKRCRRMIRVIRLSRLSRAGPGGTAAKACTKPPPVEYTRVKGGST